MELLHPGGVFCLPFTLVGISSVMSKKISQLLKEKQSFLKGFKLGLASLPLFFMNFGQSQPSILRDDGIASDWKAIGADLRNLMTKEIRH